MTLTTLRLLIHFFVHRIDVGDEGINPRVRCN